VSRQVDSCSRSPARRSRRARGGGKSAAAGRDQAVRAKALRRRRGSRRRRAGACPPGGQRRAQPSLTKLRPRRPATELLDERPDGALELALVPHQTRPAAPVGALQTHLLGPLLGATEACDCGAQVRETGFLEVAVRRSYRTARQELFELRPDSLLGFDACVCPCRPGHVTHRIDYGPALSDGAGYPHQPTQRSAIFLDATSDGRVWVRNSFLQHAPQTRSWDDRHGARLVFGTPRCLDSSPERRVDIGDAIRARLRRARVCARDRARWW
jgi:hypothetical protein